MTCKRVEWHIADWIAGRLTEGEALGVAEHCRGCARCASLAADERSMRARFAEAPTPERKLDLWPAVAVRSSGWSPARPLLWPRRLALGSTLAGACLVLALVVGNLTHPGPGPGGLAAVTAADERRAVQLVADTRQLPDVDTDAMIIEARYTAVPAVSRGAGE